ncbi:hypothetical protein LX14_002833 [Williamsia deligens]|nr:hypothetical protein [Williamsia deligens]
MSQVMSLARRPSVRWTAGWIGVYLAFVTAAFIRLAADEQL